MLIWGRINMKRGHLTSGFPVGRQSRGLCLDGVSRSSRGQGHRGDSGVDSGIRDRVDGCVTGGAQVGGSGGRGRWGRGGRRGRLFYLQKEKEKEESSRTAV